MISHYNELAVDLSRIRRFLEETASTQQNVDQRRFAYIACISALYSTFENFAERAAFRFSQLIFSEPRKCTTQQIEDLRRRYVKNASSLLGQSLGAGRYQEVTEADVARSLHSCLDESEDFQLILELVALHNTNLRWEALAELFRWATPDLQGQIQRSDAVETWMRSVADVSEGTLMTVLGSELDDLVERRNEVSHRAIPEEILSLDRLIAKTNFIEAISLGLVASLAGVLFRNSASNGQSPYLGSPSSLYKEKRVAVVPSITLPITEGDIVLAPAGRSVRWGRILELQIDDERVGRAEAGTEVGMLLDFTCRRGADLHLWRERDHELASPPRGLFGDRGPFSVEAD